MENTPFDFKMDVIAESHNQPVLVDFWAPWCAPCGVLGPVLDRLAEKADERWKLVKIDTEASPDIAREYGIRSIPHVMLFFKGKFIDEFSGALPEDQIEMWLSKRLPGPYAAMVDQAAEQAASGNSSSAITLLEEVLRHEPENLPARAVLARLLLCMQPERALELSESIDREPEYADLCEAVRMLVPLMTRPDSELPAGISQVVFASAVGCLRNGDFDGALERFICVLREDRQYDADGSRKACIAIFRLLGEGHEATMKHRRSFDRAF